MNSRLTDLARSRLAPLAILVSTVALLGMVLLTDDEPGSELDTIAAVDGDAALGGLSASDPAELSDGPEAAAAPGSDESGSAPLTLPAPTDPGAVDPSTAPSSETSTTTAAPAPAPVSCDDPWADLAGCGWPGPGNTGPRSANCPGGLTERSQGTTGKLTITEDNAVISCQRITGAVVINASNVTITDSVVTFNGGGGNGGGAIVVGDGASATIDHVEVDGLNNTHACVWYQGETVLIDAIDCHGTTDGVFVWARTGYSPTSGNNFTLRNSYFHDFTPDASNGHMDGFQTQGAANGEITHNTFLMPIEANAAVAIFNDAKSADDIRVSDNLMAGAQFTVYAMDYDSGGNTVTNITFTDNLFSTRLNACVGQWGPWFVDTDRAHQGGPTDGWRRSGNRILETGQSIDGGNPDCR